MARDKLTAPANPAAERAKRARELAGKRAGRTPAQAAELIDVLADRVEDLERRLDEFAAGR